MTSTAEVSRFCGGEALTAMIDLCHPPLSPPLPSLSLAQTEPTKKYSPSDFLKSVLGRPVKVQLNTGLEYRGILACLDGTAPFCAAAAGGACTLFFFRFSHSWFSLDNVRTGYLNLALEQSEEFRDGQLQAKYGDCFIRGNNGMSYLSLVVKTTRPGFFGGFSHHRILVCQQSCTCRLSLKSRKCLR